MTDCTDFHTVKDLKFDTDKLQKALNQVLKIKKYDTAGGISSFGAICLTVAASSVIPRPRLLSGVVTTATISPAL